MRAYRPVLLEKIGNDYYPEGIPHESEQILDNMTCTYTDLDGNVFRIVYTSEQVTRQITRSGGWFMPYTPLLTTALRN